MRSRIAAPRRLLRWSSMSFLHMIASIDASRFHHQRTDLIVARTHSAVNGTFDPFFRSNRASLFAGCLVDECVISSLITVYRLPHILSQNRIHLPAVAFAEQVEVIVEIPATVRRRTRTTTRRGCCPAASHCSSCCDLAGRPFSPWPRDLPHLPRRQRSAGDRQRGALAGAGRRTSCHLRPPPQDDQDALMAGSSDRNRQK